MDLPEGWDYETEVEDDYTAVRVWRGQEVSVKEMVQLLPQIIDGLNPDEVFFDDETGLHYKRPHTDEEREAVEKEKAEREHYRDNMQYERGTRFVNELKSMFGNDPNNWPGL